MSPENSPSKKCSNETAHPQGVAEGAKDPKSEPEKHVYTKSTRNAKASRERQSPPTHQYSFLWQPGDCPRCCRDGSVGEDKCPASIDLFTGSARKAGAATAQRRA